MPFVLALDQGTTSSRSIVFSPDGTPVAQKQIEFRQIFPRAGWVEHDPMEIWSSQLASLSGALAAAGVRASDLAAVGITNQRETTIVWDRATSRPVYNAIVWQDRRTAEACDRLRHDGAEPTIREKTGLVIDSYFSGTKIGWILDNVPGLRARAERGELAFGTVDSWLIWNLTGGKVHATDATNASRTMLYNIHTGEWDPDLLRLLRVPEALLPRVVECSGTIATVDPDLPAARAPIAGVAGDQHAALFGQACHVPGMAKATYGTGCFLLQTLGPKPVLSQSGLLTTIAWSLGGSVTYALEGAVFIGGAIVQWLRDGLRIIRSSDEVEALAASVPDSGGVCLVPALAGLGAPHWDQYARGLIIGLTRGTTHAHIARAALEGIAFEVADLMDAMRKDSGAQLPELRADGGASVNALLMRFQAEALGVPVSCSAIPETTALGAAFLAGLGVGVFKSVDEIASHWKQGPRYEPAMDRAEMDRLRTRWRRALDRCRNWERE
ncbi:MAG: glycerol kinase GlpK [Phycisphaeraceae bacterium]|nr:glycerol kinase GlpK [Phycisphaeraceae bacterium]